MYSDNIEYAKQRLVGTIVRIGPEPFLVQKISMNGNALGVTLADTDDVVEIHLDKLNLEPVSLGYVNYRGKSYYLVRKPMRRDWRQGLRMSNVAFIGDRGFAELPFKDIRNTILGQYPTVAQAVELVKKGHDKVAFSRTFALDNKYNLWYKGLHSVGNYDKLFTLAEPFKYLTEHLMETVYATN